MKQRIATLLAVTALAAVPAVTLSPAAALTPDISGYLQTRGIAYDNFDGKDNEDDDARGNDARLRGEPPAVKHWVLNVEKEERFSFWLPTAKDYVYPDFVCELADDRVLVVEYKGEVYRSNDDSHEKNQIGLQWEATSGEKCLFMMAVARDDRGGTSRSRSPTRLNAGGLDFEVMLDI